MAQLTLEKLALVLMELQIQNKELRTELDKVKDYLKKQHQLKTKK